MDGFDDAADAEDNVEKFDVGFGVDVAGGANLISLLKGPLLLLEELSAGSSSPSGEQSLQEQFMGSPSVSVASHRRCGKKSAGLLNLFLRPSGYP